MKNVIELVDVRAPNFWGHFKDGILEAGDEVCGKKSGRSCKGDAYWWNEQVNEAVSGKEGAHKVMR